MYGQNPNSVSGRWWSYIHKGKEKAAARLKAGEKSKAWYKGAEELFKKEFAEWKGELVRGNLWQRDYDILHDSLWADDPRFSVTAEMDGFDAACASVEGMAMRAWQETTCFDDMDTAFGQALHENIAWVALDYDRHRQLPRIRWVDSFVAVDPMCKGMIKRAQWISEMMDRPLMDVYTDAAIPEPMREKILKAYTERAEKYDPECVVKMAYVWSKRGPEPWAPKKLSGRKLIVICDKLDEPVLVEEWPWPFLDQDQFPLYMLRIKKVAGELEGITLFELFESLFRHYNWAVTFNLMTAKREAQKKILMNENAIRDKTEQDKVLSGRHLELIKGTGNMEEALHVVDFGNGSDLVYKTAEFSKQVHDEQSGITDVQRGMPIGGRATAEEVRSVKSNGAITFQGIAKVLDQFSNQVIHDFVLAVCYYVPAWSRIVGMDGQLWTKVKDLETGQLIDMLVGTEELESIGEFIPTPGNIVRAGVDAYLGPEMAYHWPDYEVEQLKRDFSFKVEAGSSRADAMIDEQRNTLAMLTTLGQPYLQMGMVPQYFELVKRFLLSFRPKSVYKLLPPPNIQTKMQEMMMWAGAQAMASRLLTGGMGAPAGGPTPGGDAMNMFGANPSQPMGAPEMAGQAGPAPKGGGKFQGQVSKRTSEAPA